MKRIYWSSVSWCDCFSESEKNWNEILKFFEPNTNEEEIKAYCKCYLYHIYRFVNFLKGSLGYSENTTVSPLLLLVLQPED